MHLYTESPPRIRATNASGVALVVALHVALGYALTSGLARKVVEVMKGPLETRVIEEVREDVPEPPPPPPPRLAAPPPPFIPPPEINIQAPPTASQAAITVTTTKPVEAPPPPPAPKVEAPRQPVRVAAVVQASSCRTPEYPAASRRQQETGAVSLSFLVDIDGRVLDSRIEASSGHPRLDEAARRALSLCTFTPGTLDGRPEQSWHRLRYVWQLDR